MAEHAKITALDNGPYSVKGPVVLLDAEGNEFRAERAIGEKAVLRRRSFEGRVPCCGQGRST
jgi:hypothetical protein